MSIFTSLRQWFKKPAPHFSVPGFSGFTLPFPTVGLWFCGLWPIGRTLSTKIYVAFTFFSILITVLGEIMYCVKVWGDIGAWCAVCSTTFAGWKTALVYAHFIWRSDELEDIIKRLSAEIWISREEDEKVHIGVEKKTNLLNWLSLTSFTSMTLKFFAPYLTTFYLPPEEKLFPFSVYFPFPHRDPIRYEILYYLAGHAGWSCVLCIVSHDSLLNYILIYTCAQLERLGQRIMDIGVQNEEDNAIAKALAEAVEDHNRLIKFVEQVDDLFNPNILMQYVVTSVLICVLGIQILYVPATPVSFIETTLFFMTGLGQLYGICYSGQQLIDCSQRVGDAAYSFNWFDVNRKFHMHVMMIIRRSHSPLQITAFKFSSLSMESFSSICSTAGSYFALLKQLMEEKSS